MVCALDFRSSGPGSSAGRGHCVVYWQNVRATSQKNAGGLPAIDELISLQKMPVNQSGPKSFLVGSYGSKSWRNRPPNFKCSVTKHVMFDAKLHHVFVTCSRLDVADGIKI